MGYLRHWKRRREPRAPRGWVEPPRRTTWIEHLEAAGLRLPDPASMSDGGVEAKLWEVLDALAAEREFLDGTDHLSDRELYEILLEDLLAEPYEPLTQGQLFRIHNFVPIAELDFYRYYADEEAREHYLEDPWLGELPPQEPLPFDRDRKMPIPPATRAG